MQLQLCFAQILSVFFRPLTCFVVQVVPGETALAFYRAKNATDKPVIGISTYNVVPFEAGQYFNKIQVENQYMLVLVLVLLPPQKFLISHSGINPRFLKAAFYCI